LSTTETPVAPRIIDGETFLGDPGPGGVETAAFALGPNDRGTIVRNCTIDGRNARWACKLSYAWDITFENCRIRGGTERALDIVRGGNITFDHCTFEVGEHRVITRTPFTFKRSCDIGIKAGARDITFKYCVMNDLLLGDYSIYDQTERPRTRRITLRGCANASDRTIAVRGLYAEKPITQDSEVARIILPRAITRIYFWWNRHWGDKRVLTPEQFTITDEERV
jgi:hypothetical protein